MGRLDSFFDPAFTDKNSVHSYLPIYEQVLKNFLDTPQQFKMCEVGIQRGGSIAGWCKAFPLAKVIGVDCQKNVNITFPNYQELITNAYDEDFLCQIPPRSLDFMIDDGSHAFQDILFACRHFHKLMKPGGVLVIEDVPDITWIPKMEKALPPGYKGMVVDLRKEKNRWDDVLFLIQSQ
jgi:hypothetical protein